MDSFQTPLYAKMRVNCRPITCCVFACVTDKLTERGVCPYLSIAPVSGG